MWEDTVALKNSKVVFHIVSKSFYAKISKIKML